MNSDEPIRDGDRADIRSGLTVVRSTYEYVVASRAREDQWRLGLSLFANLAGDKYHPGPLRFPFFFTQSSVTVVS